MLRLVGLLLLHSFDSAFEIVSLDGAAIHDRNKERSFREKVSHLLQRTFRGLREEAPEENSVRKIAYLRTAQSASRV